jgi:integrase/recombinase XerC
MSGQTGRPSRRRGRPPQSPELSPADAELYRQHSAWLRMRGISETTVRARRIVLSGLAAGVPVPLREVTREMLADWRASLSVTPGAIIVYVSHVQSFYGWLVRTRVIDDNPAEGLPVPRRRRRIPRPIGEDPLLDAVAAAPDRIRPWLVLAGWAGLRACEIARLRRNCVFEHATPPVILIAADATKGGRERVVPMSAFVRAELVPVLPASGWVFTRRDGRPGPNTATLVSCVACQYLHSVGIPETLHQLRHRFATQAYAVSRDIRVVQELMGHDDPATTAGYAAFSDADALAAVQGIPVRGIQPPDPEGQP